MNLLVVASLFIAPVSGTQSEITWERSELGETAMVSMKAAPFPHESREQGFKIGDKVFPREPHYTDSSVALFIPRGHRAGESIDVLVYLHGHYNNVPQALKEFKIREQIVASGKDVILIFPEGPKDAGDSGCGKLEDAGGLRRLVEESLQVLRASRKVEHERIGRVLLAGHSGAYRGMSFCVEHGGLDGELSDVCLLDASYARLDPFVGWVASSRHRRLLSIFTDHLAAKNVYLMTHLQQSDIPYALMAEHAAAAEAIRAERTVFLYAEKLNHNQTVSWLERWLATRSIPSTRPAK